MPRESKESRIIKGLNTKSFNICDSKSGSKCFKEIYKVDKKEIKKDDVFNYINQQFELNDFDNFKSKYDQAVSGDGDESVKMISVKSSSLCALLTFFNVSEKNPIRIKGDKDKYTESYFEVKNQVFNNPSNMDVVLINKEKKKIMFVECKFSEYLNKSKVLISNAYRNNAISNEIYDEAISKNIFNKTDDVAPDGYSYYASDECYMGGLKQIISHYVGLCNYQKRNKQEYMKNEAKERVDDIYNFDYESISFIEVLFGLDEFPKELESYQDKSENLLEIIRRKQTGVNYLKGTTYKNIISSDDNKAFILPPKVKEFYGY